MIYWFTGQPGHGKTTLAKALLAHLKAQGTEAFHVDGDDLRTLTTNTDYSAEAVKRTFDAPNFSPITSNPKVTLSS